MWCRCDKVEPGRPTPRRRRVYHFASTTYQSSKRILCPSDVQTKGRHMPPLSPSDATRAKWRHLLEPGWTEVMQGSRSREECLRAALSLSRPARRGSRPPACRVPGEDGRDQRSVSERNSLAHLSPSDGSMALLAIQGRQAGCRCGAAAAGPSRAHSGRLISPRSRARKSVT